MALSAERSVNHLKRLRIDGDNETKSKKKAEHSDMNGLELPRLKKTPRLSTALFQDNCEINHSQLHELLNYAAAGRCHNAGQPSWCHVLHQKHLRGVQVIVLHGLSQDHFYRYYLHLRCLRRWFRHRFALPPPPSDLIASLLGITDNNKEKCNADPAKCTQDPGTAGYSPSTLSLALDPVIQKYGKRKHGLTRYLLSEEELKNNGYPLVGSPDSENYILSGCSGEVTDDSPLFGLDCEMCLTDKGNELTRISLVDARGHCIMDELVKPDNPIQNYMTKFSGITKQILQPVKTKLKDVQDKLKSLLPCTAVLVGHSLNNDLHALQMIHINVIDTALLFAREFERKFRLKFLTQAVLGKEIQCEDVTGHNPAEDAKAALNLAQYFIHCGPEKVAQLNLQRIFRKMHPLNGSLRSQEKSPVLNQMRSLHPLEPALENPEQHPPRSLVGSLASAGRKILYVAREDAARRAVPATLLDMIACSSEEEVFQRACNLVSTSDVGIVQFRPDSLYYNSTGLHEKVAARFVEMMTVFAGPFKKDLGLRSVRKAFESCGPILSINLLAETYQPYLCIQYGVLEAAQLAVDSLDGAYVDGCCVKVQRQVTERTLDFEDIIKAMEADVENKDNIYVSGFRKSLTEEYLQQRFSHLTDIKAIFVPKNRTNGKHTKYCYLKFHSSQSADAAADTIRAQSNLKCRKALTASHLHHWLQTDAKNAATRRPAQENPLKEEDFLDIVKSLDRKIKQLYKSLQGNALCIVLFAGSNGDCGALPGFGLMAIKELAN